MDLDLVNQILTLSLHPREQVIEEKFLVEDPSGLVSNLADRYRIRIADQQDVVDALLSLQLMKRVLDVLADVAKSKPFLSQNVFVIPVVVDNLNRDLILSIIDVER